LKYISFDNITCTGEYGEICVATGNAVFTSSDQGNSWMRHNFEQSHRGLILSSIVCTGDNVNSCIAVGCQNTGRAAGTILASYTSIDGGNSWDLHASPIDDQELSMCISSISPK